MSAFINVSFINNIQIQDSNNDHNYNLTRSNLSNDTNINLPSLTSNDTFVFEDHAQTLTNKTLNSPNIIGNTTTNGYIQLADIVAPTNPGAGLGRLYKKTGDDGLFWLPDAAGPEIDLTSDKYFMAYTTVNTNINAGFTPIPWNVEQISDSIYTHAANSPNITVGEDGNYQFLVDITTGIGSGNNRSESNGRILKNAIEITGTRTFMYNRNAAQGITSGTICWIESCTAGDVISVETGRVSGTSTIFAVANHCRITIRKI
jgi:hypothetical protein